MGPYGARHVYVDGEHEELAEELNVGPYGAHHNVLEGFYLLTLDAVSPFMLYLGTFGNTFGDNVTLFST